jgi:hypothetical protein
VDREHHLVVLAVLVAVLLDCRIVLTRLLLLRILVGAAEQA